MNDDDLKKLAYLVDERVNKALESTNEKLDNQAKKLDNHSGALISIESKLDGYGDMYKINDFNIRKMEKRLEKVEKKNKIEILPELQLADVS